MSLGVRRYPDRLRDDAHNSQAGSGENPDGAATPKSAADAAVDAGLQPVVWPKNPADIPQLPLQETYPVGAYLVTPTDGGVMIPIDTGNPPPIDLQFTPADAGAVGLGASDAN
jgi:hypothetical protein